MRTKPKVHIDWDQVNGMLQTQASTEDVAQAIGISRDSLYVRCKKETGMQYTEFRQKAKATGLTRLRAKQYAVAMEGHPTMLVWLGKQHLGQKENPETDNGEVSKLDEILKRLDEM